MKYKILVIISSLLLIIQQSSRAQSVKKFTISGEIKDAKNGEELIGASVSIPSLKVGTVTNAYGFYSLSVPTGNYEVEYTYLGYKTTVKKIELSQNTRLNIELSEEKNQLKEVVISGEKLNAGNVEQNKMSVVRVEMKEVKKIPLLLGEVDIIKAVQLLPGVQAAGDGSSNLVVRGGNIDHNLVQLDEAVVYNPSHVFGFFSTFNGDAIKDFDLYKGGIPAQFGGRLAAVLDVRMRDGNSKKFQATGGIGLLSSRLTLEGPIKKDRTSFLISGRRSYFDIFFPLSSQLDGTTAWFGDLNIKLNHTISDKDKVFVSAYMGRDKLGFGDLFGFGWGNYTTTARWNHIFSSKLFLNTTAAFSRYDYNFDLNIAKNLNFTRTNYINDLNLKIDGNYFISPKNTVKFGTKQTYFVFEPGKRTKITNESLITDSSLNNKKAFQQDYYASNSQKIGARFTAEYGIRLSIFSSIAGRNYNYLTTPVVAENEILKQGAFDTINPYTVYNSFNNTYYGWEPRLNMTYLLNSTSSVKASYNRMYQYMHLIQNISAATGQEFWIPSDKMIKPQVSDQVAIGYFRNFKENVIEFSVEAYYKWMSNTLQLRDDAKIDFNDAIERELVVGQGRAYGLEFFLRKRTGKTTGWIGYTLAKSERQADRINNNDWYPFRFDRRNYLTVTLNHDISERVSIGANFIYATGDAFTIASQRYTLESFDGSRQSPSIQYASRNSARFPDYHRLDLSVTLNRKKIEGKNNKNDSYWVFSLYNAYGQKNPYTLSYGIENNVPVVYKWYLFTFVPAVTYNFKF
jgi:hypothetical protein